MTYDKRYSSTVHAPLDDMAPTPEAIDASMEGRHQDFDAVGAVGMELASVMAQLKLALDALVREHRLAPDDMARLSMLMGEAERISRHSRLLARISEGSLQHHHVQLSLDQLLEQLLGDTQVEGRSGLDIKRSIQPASIISDRDLVATLLKTALDWSLALAPRLEVSLHIKDWPAHALLRINALGVSNSRTDGTSEPEKVAWYLIQELGRQVGAIIDRVSSPGQVLVMLEFPRTVREMEGLSAMEVDLGAASATGHGSGVLAGHRALIISSDVKLREDVKRVCRVLGLEVDNVPSSALALKRCAVEPPHVLIVDERFNDERFRQLRTLLEARQPNFPVVEIAYGNTGTVAVWGGEGLTRVGRSEILAQLPQSLALEMAKVL